MSRPSNKQSAARARNWSIRRLRSIAATCRSGPLTYDESSSVLSVIDEALTRLGAETEADRSHRIALACEDT